MTGASGMLGRRVAALAEERGHSVRKLSRSDRPGDGWLRGDVVSGDGLEAAGAGAEVILHCASNPRRHRTTDIAGTRHVAATAATSGALLVFPGIVGSDLIPLGYYRSKTRAEEVLASSGCRFTIQRYTQFHELLWKFLDVLTRPPVVTIVPNDTRFQVLDTDVAARLMLEAAEAGEVGRLPDVGGPTVYDAKELAQSVSRALGRRRRVVGVNIPGVTGAAFRAGANLTETRDHSGATWNEFVASKLGA